MKKFKLKKKFALVAAMALVACNLSTSVFAGYTYSGSFDFNTGSNGTAVLSGASNKVFRKFDDGKTTMKSTDTPTPSVGTYTPSLVLKKTLIDKRIGSYGTWTHSRGVTHTGYVTISEGTSSNYYMLFSGTGYYNVYAGDFTLTQ